jgi:transcriptional regulator with XRE-family HTH domain
MSSYVLDIPRSVSYIGRMNLASLGQTVAQRRRASRQTLAQLAAVAQVGRSTLAAFEAGKLAELGFAKVARICEAVGLALEARPLRLDAPLMAHRHLTDTAGRDLTKAAIADVVLRGDISAWRGLVRALRSQGEGDLGDRVRAVVAALDPEDVKVRAFASLLPHLERPLHSRTDDDG